MQVTGRITKHPANWLRGFCWLDELTDLAI
ncbi:hypothetical protein SAMN05443248_3441 [Bradyrhizobium erythrophlei]|uniref:Uncharacterized protein n=1 Tax=Bradyrhizobium erythrophlei TaxID=1437360 RepID=A0A1M5PPP6_9BRAD|nr:hypothetical protein SAMN05443248_3441 [Bradyrhizobium erythrophlei]